MYAKGRANYEWPCMLHKARDSHIHKAHVQVMIHTSWRCIIDKQAGSMRRRLQAVWLECWLYAISIATLASNKSRTRLISHLLIVQESMQLIQPDRTTIWLTNVHKSGSYSVMGSSRVLFGPLIYSRGRSPTSNVLKTQGNACNYIHAYCAQN